MSDSEEPEYEVESLVAAKVFAVSPRAKHPKLFWKYLVRWKGYSADEDTWEPVESFQGSDNLVEDFWKRVTIHGRDVEDMSLFRLGEEFRPVGPPRHKPKPKTTGGKDVETSNSKSVLPSPGKRQRSSDIVESSERLVKRPRSSATKPSQTPMASTSSSKLPSEGTRSTRSKDVISAGSRPSSSRRQSHARKPPSPEVIPDSDEGRNGGNLLRMPSAVISEKSAMTPKPTKRTRKTSSKVRQVSPIVIEDDSPPPSPSVAPVQQVEEESASRVPVHRARLANPRVKLVDDAQLASMEGAIPTKIRVAENVNAEPSTSRPASRSKPGPGRSSAGLKPPKNTSSLLTMEKGTLKSVKGRVSARISARAARKESQDVPVDVDAMELGANVEVPPPSADELLQMAGLNEKSVEGLSDFEEDPAGDQANVAKAPEKLAENSGPSKGAQDEAEENLRKEEELRKKSLELAKNNLFPQQQIAPPPVINEWGRSTIFGQLSLAASATKTEGLTMPPAHLHLDAAITIPVLVSEVSAAPRLSFSQTLGDTQQAPGKFYQTDAALSLLGTVRATGDFAIITALDTAAPEENNQFQLFHKRLEEGEMFVAMAGVHLLVFSSSTNTLLSSRLNAPANLLNQPGNVLVSHVDIQNYSGYAEAASKADTRRWAEYLFSA